MKSAENWCTKSVRKWWMKLAGNWWKIGEKLVDTIGGKFGEENDLCVCVFMDGNW